MRLSSADLRGLAPSGRSWLALLTLAASLAAVLALVVVALSAFLFVLPAVLIGGLALRWSIRRRARRSAAAYAETFRAAPGRPVVIEGEYTVISRS